MKRAIFINQEYFIRNNIDVDLSEAAILDYLINIPYWKNVSSFVESGKTFYWVSYDMVLAQLPLLKIKKDTVYRKIKKMDEMGFIQIHEGNSRMGKTYIFLTDKIKEIIFGAPETTENTRQSEPSDLNPGVNPRLEPKNHQNDQKTSYTPPDLNPTPPGFKSEGILPNIIQPENTEEKKIKKQKKEIGEVLRERGFNFICKDFLKTVTEDSEFDLDGRILHLVSYNSLKKLSHQQLTDMILKERKEPRACEDYATALVHVMNENYQEEQQKLLTQYENGEKYD